ncbi:hypothetical protein AYO41_02350 [Verrucomicrobia bacterium SCGC AG-212-E04]|nr:hypothetical protein AYO41_02350 [Verrucomicrobia bacterium SCGC AG-212-E04]
MKFRPNTANKPNHIAMKIIRSSLNPLLVTITVALSGAAFVGSVVAADEDTGALQARLSQSKHTLADGVAQAEKDNGVAISAKFEIEDGTLWLSVYTAKAGGSPDAENNALIELKGDATQSAWTPATEVFEDKKHLTRAATQLTLVQLGRISLRDVIATAKKAQSGEVYSVIPAVQGSKPVFIVKIAKAGGESVSLSVDAQSGAVLK